MRKCVWKRTERMCSLTFDKISVGSYHKLKQPSQWKPGAILQDNGRMTKEGDLEIIMAVIATTDPECKGPRSTALSEWGHLTSLGRLGHSISVHQGWNPTESYSVGCVQWSLGNRTTQSCRVTASAWESHGGATAIFVVSGGQSIKPKRIILGPYGLTFALLGFELT